MRTRSLLTAVQARLQPRRWGALLALLAVVLGARVIVAGRLQVGELTHLAKAFLLVLVVAALGVSCALAAWPVLIVGFAGTLLLLIVCGPIENAIQRAIDRRQGNGGDGALPPGGM